MKKKLLGILFVLGLLMALPSVVSFAETKSGTCGVTGKEANVTWVLDDNGTLTISGTGNMKDYNLMRDASAPWYNVRVDIQTVVIGSGVTKIGDWAFSDCTNLTSVTIQNNVPRIGKYAFKSCTSLKSVTIPDSVTCIESYAFKSCTSLKSVKIPDSVKTMDFGVFSGCTSLTSVTIPNSITGINWDTFNNCTSLKSVTIPDGITGIYRGAFNNCTSLKSVTIPDSVKRIEDNVFVGCTSLKSVTIPNGVPSIEVRVFDGCTGLTSVTIPNSVTSIGNEAFRSCTSLKSVTIPNSVTGIEENTFFDCTSLTTIYAPMHYDTESETYKELDLKSANIPETATKLYYTAGAAGGNITPVTIDKVDYGTGKDSITLPCDIMGNGYIIRSAGENTGVTIEHKCEIYTPVTEGNLAAKCKICSDVTIPGPIDPYANLVISETVTVNGEKLPVTAISGNYMESGYTTVTVPKDVKYINKGAFYTNENLDTIYLPEGCQMESESVPLTTKIVYYKVNKDERGNAVVETASTGEEITQVTVSGVDVLKPDQELNLNNIYGKYKITAVADNALDNSGKNLHTVILPNSVESINAEVFGNCKNLETIYLKEGCTIKNEEKIADKNLIYYTDDGATISNAKINIDNFPLELSKINNRCNITTIGENAFKDQVKMKSVTIPTTVTSIGTNPFAGCTGLHTIKVDGDNGAYKFENGVLLSGNGATLVCYLAGNAGTTYTTPESVTAIAAQAFADCKNLKNVVLRENVTSVGADAFTGCDKLMAVYVWHLKSTSEEKDCDIDSTVLNSENIIYYIVADSTLSTNSSPKEVTIGKKIDIIEGEKLDNLEGNGCRINKDGTELDLGVLNNTGLYEITCIGAGAFYQEGGNQGKLKGIIIPEGVTDVKTCFLRCSRALEFVKLPTTLTSSLPQYSITDTEHLKTLTIPHKVGGIHEEAFTSTESLETVYVRQGLSDDIDKTITNKGNLAKANIIYFNIPTTYGSQTNTPIEICIGKHSASVTENNLSGSCIINRNESTVDLRTIDENYKIKEIGTSAFSGYGNEKNRCNLKTVIIPEGVENIAQEAFRMCQNLTSITLPTTYNNGLHYYFITGSSCLEKLVVPYTVTAINDKAFADVKNLERVYVPNKENFNTTPITNYSASANIIKYRVVNREVSPQEVKITDATLSTGVSSIDVYCDEMGDRYVITGFDDEVEVTVKDAVKLKHKCDVEVPEKETTCTENGTRAHWKCLCGGEKYENTAGKPGEKIENEEDLIIAAGHTSLSEVPAKAATFHACGVEAHYKCDGCGKLFSDGSATTELNDNDVNISEHQGHNFGAYSHDYENQALHADVCALKGTVAATCAICDQTDVKSCAEHTKSSHVWTKGEKIPATCKTTGTQAYTCSLCNEPETKILEIDPNNHTYGEVEYTWSDDYTACTAKRVCNNDANHVETEEATVTSEATQEATCTQAEVTTYTATFNKEVFKKQTKVVTGEIDSNNHDYSIEVEGTAEEATCTAKGKEADKRCLRCGVVQTGKEIEIDSNNHDYSIEVEGTAKEATCTAKGKEADKKCSRCEAVQTGKEIEIDPNNHTNVEKTEAKAATCTEAGNNEYWHCEVCDKYFKNEECTQETSKEAETIKALGHTKEHITEVAATCTEAGNNEYWHCEICDKYFKNEECTQETTKEAETIKALGHTKEHITEVAATCTEAGNNEYWHCKACDKYFADAACENEITKDDVIIPAGHDFESSTKYSYNSTQHWKKCSRCDEEDVNNKEEHKYSSVENKCDVCGYAKGTTPDTYTVSGTVYTWDNTDSNTTRVRLYSSTTSEADIKSDIQHDITGESDTKIYQYDANEIGTPEESTSNRYTQSFEFTGVANGEYKLAAWRPAYDISNKHYAYAVRITDVTVNGTDVNVDENATKLWLYGDVTNNGKIEANDAANILAFIVGNTSSVKAGEMSYTVGDVTKNGKIEANDAANILAFIVGNKSSLA